MDTFPCRLLTETDCYHAVFPPKHLLRWHHTRIVSEMRRTPSWIIYHDLIMDCYRLDDSRGGCIFHIRKMLIFHRRERIPSVRTEIRNWSAQSRLFNHRFCLSSLWLISIGGNILWRCNRVGCWHCIRCRRRQIEIGFSATGEIMNFGNSAPEQINAEKSGTWIIRCDEAKNFLRKLGAIKYEIAADLCGPRY